MLASLVAVIHEHRKLIISRLQQVEELTNDAAYQMKKALRETQTLRAGCSKAEPKKFAPPQTGRPPCRGRGTAKI